MVNQYEFVRSDGIKVSLKSLSNIDERYGENGEQVENLQRFTVSITLPNGKVIDNVEIIGQIDEALLENADYSRYVQEEYLDPKRIQRYARERNTNYMGTIEQDDEGFYKQITPEIMDRYKVTYEHQRGDYGDRNYEFNTKDGTRVEVEDVSSFNSQEQDLPPLHEYRVKILGTDGRMTEGTVYGRIDTTKLQERIGTEYNPEALKYKNFLEQVYLEPNRLISAMEREGGYIGRTIDNDNPMGSTIVYSDNEFYQNSRGKSSIMRNVELSPESLEIEKSKAKKFHRTKDMGKRFYGFG